MPQMPTPSDETLIIGGLVADVPVPPVPSVKAICHVCSGEIWLSLNTNAFMEKLIREGRADPKPTCSACGRGLLEAVPKEDVNIQDVPGSLWDRLNHGREP